MQFKVVPWIIELPYIKTLCYREVVHFSKDFQRGFKPRYKTLLMKEWLNTMYYLDSKIRYKHVARLTWFRILLYGLVEVCLLHMDLMDTKPEKCMKNMGQKFAATTFFFNFD